MAKLSLKTQGIRGKEPKWNDKMGRVDIYVENNSWIIADAYEGQGNNYKERKDTNITIIEDGNILFAGRMEELKQQLLK
jgi:hypothetical protein